MSMLIIYQNYLSFGIHFSFRAATVRAVLGFRVYLWHRHRLLSIFIFGIIIITHRHKTNPVPKSCNFVIGASNNAELMKISNQSLTTPATFIVSAGVFFD